ncbi:hypothetical protein PN466_20320 [Roseofilum reptotaenium CS-1145]|uniref:Uncharacterized protein n=1 Tax=Roseofilum reptotaenium AO1-A TaxID=1925591 RepID=A0A1L9QWZ7_9CYAN|nr:hypothetical protein [Roseofilum reptotaenium]MDB9519296.1 hypothetical protein [Roseofilum reptotaenium CS-1145]OJJ27208.1 hypothetical protein BI308_01590 [Roseofilum reptotaenium AO1-A]
METSERPHELLVSIQEILTSWEIENQWIEPTEEVPYYGLLARFYLLDGFPIDWQFCILPKLHESEDFATQEFLQLFIELSDKVTSEHLDRTLREIAAINLNLPFGAFGVVEDLQVLYFKHNTLIDIRGNNTPYRSRDRAITLDILQNQWSMILYSINLFFESLMQTLEN